MSRSYRKPWAKDPSNSKGKKIFSRAYRSRCRQISRVWSKHWISPCFMDEYLDPIYPSKHEIMDQYDICDYRFYEPHLIRYKFSNGHFEENKYHKKYCRK